MSLDGYLLSIDQGTTSSRALILDIQGNIISQKTSNLNSISRMMAGLSMIQ